MTLEIDDDRDDKMMSKPNDVKIEKIAWIGTVRESVGYVSPDKQHFA